MSTFKMHHLTSFIIHPPGASKAEKFIRLHSHKAKTGKFAIIRYDKNHFVNISHIITSFVVVNEEIAFIWKFSRSIKLWFENQDIPTKLWVFGSKHKSEVFKSLLV